MGPFSWFGVDFPESPFTPIVDRRGFEPLIVACDTTVLPDYTNSPTVLSPGLEPGHPKIPAPHAGASTKFRHESNAHPEQDSNLRHKD